MKYISLLLTLMLTACATSVPVTAKFPEPPTIGQSACPPLKTLTDTAKLSDIANTVAMNYSTYYECAVKVDTWNEWYAIQKNLFENIK
jgi:hypothetical protein